MEKSIEQRSGMVAEDIILVDSPQKNKLALLMIDLLLTKTRKKSSSH
jgi:hypothetical protein